MAPETKIRRLLYNFSSLQGSGAEIPSPIRYLIIFYGSFLFAEKNPLPGKDFEQATHRMTVFAGTEPNPKAMQSEELSNSCLMAVVSFPFDLVCLYLEPNSSQPAVLCD